jgi:hypothetical protein
MSDIIAESSGRQCENRDEPIGTRPPSLSFRATASEFFLAAQAVSNKSRRYFD